MLSDNPPIQSWLNKNFEKVLFYTLFLIFTIFMALMPVHAGFLSDTTAYFNDSTGHNFLQNGDILTYSTTDNVSIIVTFYYYSGSDDNYTCKGNLPHNASCWVDNGTGSWRDLYVLEDAINDPVLTPGAYYRTVKLNLTKNLLGCNRLFCYASCDNNNDSGFGPRHFGYDLAYFLVVPNSSYVGSLGKNPDFDSNLNSWTVWDYGSTIPTWAYYSNSGVANFGLKAGLNHTNPKLNTGPNSLCYTSPSSHWATDWSWIPLTGGECCFIESVSNTSGNNLTARSRTSSGTVISGTMNMSANHNISYTPSYSSVYDVVRHNNVPITSSEYVLSASSASVSTSVGLTSYKSYFYDPTFSTTLSYALNVYNPASLVTYLDDVQLGYSINTSAILGSDTWQCFEWLQNASGTRALTSRYFISNSIQNITYTLPSNYARGYYYFTINCTNQNDRSLGIGNTTSNTFYWDKAYGCSDINLTSCPSPKISVAYPICCSCPNTCTYGYVGGTCSCAGCSSTCPDGYLQMDYPGCTCYQTCSQVCGAWNVMTESPCLCRLPYNGGYCGNQCQYGYGAGIGNCTCLGKPNPPFSDYWVINDTSTFVSKILSDSPNLIIILGMITLLVVILISIVLLIKAIGGSLGGVIGDR